MKSYLIEIRCVAVLLALFSFVHPVFGAFGVEQKPVKVFILAGQSNAVGYNQMKEFKKGKAAFPPEYLNQSKVQLWARGSWRELQAGKSGGNREGAFGPEVSFAYDMQRMFPEETIAIIKYAQGGTGIARSSDYSDCIPKLKGFDDKGRNWHPLGEGASAGLLYKNLLATVRNAVAELERQNKPWEFAGFLWVQGEHEAGISQKMAQDYDGLLKGLISSLRKELKSPALPFLIVEVNGNDWRFADVVRKNQVKVCDEDAHSVLVKAADLSRAGSGGLAHFDADGMLTLGSRLASAMKLYMVTSSLFNGENLDGWHSKRPALWRVEDGEIVGAFSDEKLSTSDFLFSDFSCGNFHLKFQVKVVGDRGNSGVHFWSEPFKEGAKGFQADIGKGYWGHLYEEYGRGLVRKASKGNDLIKVDGWNDYEIWAVDGQISIKINGHAYLNYKDDGTGMTRGRKQVKGATSGRFGLQLHPGLNEGKGTEVRFRSFELVLNPDPVIDAKVKAVKEVDLSKVAYADYLGAHLLAEPKTVEEQLACFKLPEGFIIENVSNEKLGAVKPISLKFDDGGRLWTQTASNYPKDRQPEVWAKKGTDKILVIDTPWKSEPQAARVFADGLTMPISILPHNDQVLAIQGPEILSFRDTDGDGKADSRDVLLSGFGVQDTHTMISRMTLTPGGWITVTQGVHCKGTVRSKSGMKQAFNDGAIARFRPNGEAFEIIGEGLNNIWAWSLDRFGRTFIHEANDLGFSQVAFERDATYASFLKTMSRSKLLQPPTAQGLKLGGSGFCGIASAGDSSSGFPDDWKLRNFIANPITGEIHSVSYKIDALGNPSFKKLENLVSCSDKMFRPVDVLFGPDGCLYIADWYDRTVVHGTSVKNPEVNDRMSGRIWRVRHKSQPAYKPVNVKKSKNEELVSHFSSGNLWRMRAACNQITFRQATELIPALKGLIGDPASSDSGRIHALWALEGLGHFDIKLWDLLFASSNQHVRHEAVRSLSTLQPALEDVFGSLQGLLKKESSYYVMNEVVRFFRDTPQALGADHRVFLKALYTPEGELSQEKVKGWKHTYHQLGGAYEKRFMNQLIESVGKKKVKVEAYDTTKWDGVIAKVPNDKNQAESNKAIRRLNGVYKAGKPASKVSKASGEAHYKARCASCHDRGIAPPVNNGGDRHSLEILTAIYKPNDTIEPLFRVYRIEKKDGTSVEGFRSDANKGGIELTFMGGTKVLVPASSIKKAGYVSGKSFMLSGMTGGMTDQQVVDLLHYLGAQK